MRALERAIAFCQSTLSYGRAQEPPPDRKPVDARAAGRGGARDAGLAGRRRIGWIAAIERGLMVDADPDQLLPRAAQSRAQRRAGAGDAARRTIRRATRSASPAGARARWW